MFIFSKQQRINRRREYECVFKGGHKIVTKGFVVYHLKNDYSKARLGLTVSKKSVPRACDRNKIKRYIRESFRSTNLPFIDIVFVARSGLPNVHRAEINENLQYIWKKLIHIYEK